MKQNLNDIMEYYPDCEFTTADGFDDCIIGVDELTMRLIYSVSMCIEKLHNDGMSLEEAIEYFDYNIGNAYVGEKTPIWCYDLFDFVYDSI